MLTTIEPIIERRVVVYSGIEAETVKLLISLSIVFPVVSLAVTKKYMVVSASKEPILATKYVPLKVKVIFVQTSPNSPKETNTWSMAILSLTVQLIITSSLSVGSVGE